MDQLQDLLNSYTKPTLVDHIIVGPVPDENITAADKVLDQLHEVVKDSAKRNTE